MPYFFMMGGSLPAITFTDLATSTVNATSINFGSLNIGAARGDRTVIAALGLVRASGAVGTPSLTINGVNAPRQVFTSITAAQSAGSAIFALNVPAGTTATFVASSTFSFGPDGGVALAVWSATGLLSSTATATDGDTVGPITLSVPVQANGVAVVCASAAVNGGVSWSWTGLTPQFNTGGVPSSSGGSISVSGATTVNVSGNGAGFEAGVAAAFR